MSHVYCLQYNYHDELNDRNKNDLIEENDTKIHDEEGSDTEVNDKEIFEST